MYIYIIVCFLLFYLPLMYFAITLAAKYKISLINENRELNNLQEKLQNNLSLATQMDSHVSEINTALEEKTEQIIKLFETAKDIGSTLEFDNIFSIIISTLRDLFAFSEAELILFTRKGQKLYIENIYAFSGVKDASYNLIEHPSFLAYRITTILKDRKERSILYIENTRQSLLARQLHISDNVKSYAIVPLITADESIGFLALTNIESPNVDWLTTLAPQFALGLKKAKLYKQVQELSITDGLTKLYLRRFIMARFEEELNRAKRFGLKLSVVMVDIDYFKRVNDRYGHLVGDVILQKIADILKQNIREIDLVGKYGGEEFIIILPETDSDEAYQISARLCEIANETTHKAYDENINVSISLGISTYPNNAKTCKDLITCADEALYQAKNSGRNQVVISPKDSAKKE